MILHFSLHLVCTRACIKLVQYLPTSLVWYSSVLQLMYRRSVI